MEIRDRVLLNLDTMLGLLASLPEQELRAGWDDTRARNWTNIFTRLRDVLINNAPLGSEYRNVVFSRGMDMDGICSGQISDLAVAVDLDLRAMVADEDHPTSGDAK